MNFDIIRNLSEDSRATALKALTNLAYGNLLIITRIRERNYQQTGDYEMSKGERDGQRDDDHQTSAASRAEELGFKKRPSLMERGHMWASLALSCIDEARALNLVGEYDRPQSIRGYMENMAMATRRREPTAAEIRSYAETLYIDDAESVARQWAYQGLAQKAGQLESETEMMVNAFNDYDGEAKEDVFDMFNLADQHRMIIKIADALVYDGNRLSGQVIQQRAKSNGGLGNTFIMGLQAKQEIQFGDAIDMVELADQFLKENKVGFDKLFTENPEMQLFELSPGNRRSLEIYTSRKAQKLAIEKEAALQAALIVAREEAERKRRLNLGSDNVPFQTLGADGRTIIDQRSKFGH